MRINKCMDFEIEYIGFELNISIYTYIYKNKDIKYKYHKFVNILVSELIAGHKLLSSILLSLQLDGVSLCYLFWLFVRAKFIVWNSI